MKPDLIMDSQDLAEFEALDDDESQDLSDLTATKAAHPETMDFHVQMRGYTMRDFEAMVVNAAAHQLIGGRTFKAEIEAKASEIANAKLDARLNEALRDVMGMTVAQRGKEPVTLGQQIGMEAKDYLTQPVDREGKPVTDSWGRSSSQPRISHIVGGFVRQHFAKEITEAMTAMRSEIAAAVAKQLSATIEAERARVAEALGFEIKRSR